MARTRYIVSYDIASPRRLRRVAKTCEAFGTRIQYSVFECPLDNQRLVELRGALGKLLHPDEDQVLFISLGLAASDASLKIEAMGLPYLVRTRVTIV
jgi:CRISPR-associated protein Cas2